MRDYVIIPDSSCDLTADLRERFDIPDYLPGTIYFPDGHSEPADLDWKNISPDDYFASMRERKVLYKTATPEMGTTLAIFEKYLAQGQDILNISISTGLSATYEECKMAAQELLQKYPERKIICIDSLRYSTSLALLVISAAQMRAEGMSLEEVAAAIEEEKHCIHQSGPMDDLFFLVKTGRISNFKAFFGNMVGLNLLADFNEQGLSEVMAKFKGKKDTLKATIEYMRRTVVDPEDQIMFVAHSYRPEVAKQLAAMVKDHFHPKEIIMNRVGQVCGANIGPGLCAVFYKGKPISKDNLEERAILAEISTKIKEKKA